MMDFPTISIVVPVYNTASYLPKCLNSLLAQTYKNIEIIVGNNGSTDDSASIIKEYTAKDSRIRSIEYQHVNTVNESRLHCYIKATGEWVLPVDSDDYVDSEFVEKMWNRHLETGADLICGRMVFVDNEGKRYNVIPSPNFDKTTILSNKEAIRLTLGGWTISGSGALRKREIVLKNNSIYNQLPYETDELEFRRILRDCNKIAFAETDYYYNYNPNSVGRTISWRKFEYNLTTFRGLLDFTQQEFGKNSQEWKYICSDALSCYVTAVKFYYQNKKRMSKEEKDRATILLRQVRIRVLKIDSLPVLFLLLRRRKKEYDGFYS